MRYLLVRSLASDLKLSVVFVFVGLHSQVHSLHDRFTFDPSFVLDCGLFTTIDADCGIVGDVVLRADI